MIAAWGTCRSRQRPGVFHLLFSTIRAPAVRSSRQATGVQSALIAVSPGKPGRRRDHPRLGAAVHRIDFTIAADTGHRGAALFIGPEATVASGPGAIAASAVLGTPRIGDFGTRGLTVDRKCQRAKSQNRKNASHVEPLSMNLLADASTISARNGFKPAEMPCSLEQRCSAGIPLDIGGRRPVARAAGDACAASVACRSRRNVEAASPVLYFASPVRRAGLPYAAIIEAWPVEIWSVVALVVGVLANLVVLLLLIEKVRTSPAPAAHSSWMRSCNSVVVILQVHHPMRWRGCGRLFSGLLDAAGSASGAQCRRRRPIAAA
jgi:hypothetical protein